MWSDALETSFRVWVELDKLDDAGLSESPEAEDLLEEGDTPWCSLLPGEIDEFRRRVRAHLDIKGKKD